MKADDIFSLGITYLLAYGLGYGISRISKGIPNLIIIGTIIFASLNGLNIDFENLKYFRFSDIDINFILFPTIPILLIVLPSIVNLFSSFNISFNLSYYIHYRLKNILKILLYPFIAIYKLSNLFFSTIFKILIFMLSPCIAFIKSNHEKRKSSNYAKKIIRTAEKEKDKYKKDIAVRINKIFSKSDTLEEFELLLTNSFLVMEDINGVLHLTDTRHNVTYSFYDLDILDDYFTFCKRINANRKEEKQTVDNEEETIEWWTILNVSKNASESEIKEAYHKLCFQFHPDYNNSASRDEFLKIQTAYNIALKSCKQY